MILFFFKKMIFRSILYLVHCILVVQATKGAYRLDFEVVPSKRSLEKKDLMKQNLLNDKNMYLARFFIGSNQDMVKLQIDTGCSDFWVMASNVDCKPHIPRRDQYDVWTRCSCDDIAAPTSMVEGTCVTSGSFRANSSTTFEHLENEDFQDKHMGRGKLATGYWGIDDVRFANQTLRIPFGVVNVSNVDEGVLGLGFPNQSDKHSSFPYELKKRGLIERAAYSLYFNSSDSKIGSILFGGIDHAKYTPDLKTIPAVRNKYANQLAVNIDQMVMTMNDTKTIVIGSQKTTYLLDTASPISRFPLRVVDTMADALGGRIYKETNDLIVQKCPDSWEFNIDFDGQLVKIPGSSFMHKSIGDHCLIRIQVDDLTPAIGQDLLRSMYIVVDLEEEQVSVADAKFTQDYEIELFPPVGTNRSNSVEYTGKEKEESAGNVHSIEILVAWFMWLLILITV